MDILSRQDYVKIWNMVLCSEPGPGLHSFPPPSPFTNTEADSSEKRSAWGIPRKQLWRPPGRVEMSPLSASQVIYLERCRQCAYIKHLPPRRQTKPSALTLPVEAKWKNKTGSMEGKRKYLVQWLSGATTPQRLTVLTSVNPGSRWKGRRALGSGDGWVLPSVGRASDGRGLWHTLPETQKGSSKD